MRDTSDARAWDVVVVGGLNTDFVALGRDLPGPGLSLEGASFLQGPGGKGANAAVAARRLGARTAIIGRVGADARGRALVAALAEEDVATDWVGSDTGAPSGAAVIQVGGSGQKQILAALGANLRLRPEHVEAAAGVIESARVLLMQLEVPAECALAAARLAHAAGVRVVLDPAPPRRLPDELVPLLHAVRGNASEIEALSRIRIHDRRSASEAARALLSRGVEVVVVPIDDGNLVVWQDQEEWIAELPVRRVDATGAGDAFSAAMAVALGEGLDFASAGRFAGAAAALTTTALGAQNALPRRADLERFLEERYETPERTRHR